MKWLALFAVIIVTGMGIDTLVSYQFGMLASQQPGYSAQDRGQFDRLIRHVNEQDKGVMVRTRLMVLYRPKSERERARIIASIFNVDVRGN